MDLSGATTHNGFKTRQIQNILGCVPPERIVQRHHGRIATIAGVLGNDPLVACLCIQSDETRLLSVRYGQFASLRFGTEIVAHHFAGELVHHVSNLFVAICYIIHENQPQPMIVLGISVNDRTIPQALPRSRQTTSASACKISP